VLLLSDLLDSSIGRPDDRSISRGTYTPTLPSVRLVASCFHRLGRVKCPRQLIATHRSAHTMKVWIDQDLCTGDGLCEEIAPDVFTLLDDGLAYVKEGDKIFATAKGNPQGADGLAEIPDGQIDAVIESAEECPGECIFIEP
jgi:ferredoxin